MPKVSIKRIFRRQAIKRALCIVSLSALAVFCESANDHPDKHYSSIEDCKRKINRNSAAYCYANLIVHGLKRLENCSLSRQNLEGADLRGLVLKHCTMDSANFMNVDFTGADLRESRPQFGHFQGANFSNANLTGLYFGKPEENLKGAKVNRKTIGIDFAEWKSYGVIILDDKGNPEK